MAVDFSKHTEGDIVNIYACDECVSRSGVLPKYPADSGSTSYLCEICGHYGMGSLMDCMITSWLRIKPLPLAPTEDMSWHEKGKNEGAE